MNGCDISVHQGTVDFDLLRQEVDFVIVKATEGVGYRDPMFSRNWSEAHRVGMLEGAYHFARPDLGNSAQEEATYFLSQLPPLGSEDFLALDYEVDWGGDVVGWCLDWLDRVCQATGVKPFVYINLSLARSHIWTAIVNEGYPLWLADYDGDPTYLPLTPWPTIAMKQWTSGGSLAGIVGRVDLNTWFKEDEMAVVSKDTYIAIDPADGKSLEDRVKETDRLLWVVEFVPQMRAELAESAASTEQKAVIEALLDVLESALKPKP